MPQPRLPDDREGIQDNTVQRDKDTSDLQFYGGAFTKAGVFGGSLEVYGYGRSERDSADRSTRNRHIFTPGLRAYRAPKSGHIDDDLEGAYQFGRARDFAPPQTLRT